MSSWRGGPSRSAKPVKAFSDAEVKFLDSELVSTAVDSNWTVHNPTGTGCTNSISVPAQGDGESERDGRVYYIHSVHVKGLVRTAATESAAGPTGPMQTRVVLYWDTQTNGAEATATDIMASGLTEDILAFRNLQNSKRFIVLADETYTLNPQIQNEGAANLFAADPSLVSFKFNKVFSKPIKVRCSGTTANVSSVTDNNIGIAAIRDDNAPVNTNIEYSARIRFTG